MDRRTFTHLAAATGLANACGLGLGAPPTLAASGRPNALCVLELFTSQGCSSCPAADALFERYARRPDLVALTLPVDYWDYLGWKDTLANHKFTKRQRSYARHRGDGQIYTPQLIVNGMAHVNGTNAATIEALVAKAASARPGWTDVQLSLDDEHIIVSASASPTRSDGGRVEATLWLAPVSRRVHVSVKRGENAGKTLTYFNVAREVSAIGTWTGDALTVRLPRTAIDQKNGEDAVAVVLQKGMAGSLFGAAMIDVA